MIESILLLLAVFIAYVALFIAIPWKLLGYKFEEGKCIERVISSMAVGMLTVILVVFALVFCKILYPVTLFASLVAVVAVSILIFRRKEAADKYERAVSAVELFSGGYYRPKTVLRNWAAKKLGRAKELVGIFFANPLSNILFLGALCYGTYLVTHHSVTHYYYGLSDVYSHTKWVAGLQNQVVFYNGVYPYGMHNLVLALVDLFHFDTVTVLRFFGCINGVFLIIAFYLFLTKIFRSKFAANFAFIIYCFSAITENSAYFRQSVSLPQETGLVFLFPAVYFFIDYLNEKEKSKLILFSVTTALTFLFHFYVTLALAIFCAFYFMVHAIRIFKDKMFFRIVAAVAAAFVVAAVPLIIGLTSGIPWEHSMDWATSSMEVQKEKNLELKAELSALPYEDFLNQKYDVKLEFFQSLTFEEKITPKYFFMAVEFHSEEATVSVTLFYFYVASIVVGALYSFIMIILKKDRLRTLNLLATVMCSAFFVAMIFFGYFDLPVLFNGGRIIIFNFFLVSLNYSIGIEIIFSNAFRQERKIIPSIVFTLCAAAFFAGLATQTSRSNDAVFRSENIFFPSQYDGAIISYYRIKKEFPKYSWTIISPVEEMPMVLNAGFHYELWEFVYNQSNYHEEPDCVIPTEHLFFYIEKYPLMPFEPETLTREIPYDPEDYATISFEEASEGVPVGAYYSDNHVRRVLSAKAYMWVQEYQKYYPQEMTVYYEDDDIIVYHLRQNPYYHNNLLLDYGYN